MPPAVAFIACLVRVHVCKLSLDHFVHAQRLHCTHVTLLRSAQLANVSWLSCLKHTSH